MARDCARPARSVRYSGIQLPSEAPERADGPRYARHGAARQSGVAEAQVSQIMFDPGFESAVRCVSGEKGRFLIPILCGFPPGTEQNGRLRLTSRRHFAGVRWARARLAPNPNFQARVRGLVYVCRGQSRTYSPPAAGPGRGNKTDTQKQQARAQGELFDTSALGAAAQCV